MVAEEDIKDFHSSCASLVSSLVDDPSGFRTASIEDLTKALKEFGSNDSSNESKRESIFSELDELIGNFLELSGQQYIVKSTISIEDFTVCITETESLQVVNRDTFMPSFIVLPERTDYSDDGPVKFTAVVSGVPRPHIEWWKNNMLLDDQTQMVDVLGSYAVVADNAHGTVDATVSLNYGLRPPRSINGSAIESETSCYTARSEFSEFSTRPKYPSTSCQSDTTDTEATVRQSDESSDWTDSTTVRDDDLHINSTDTETEDTPKQTKDLTRSMTRMETDSNTMFRF